MAWKLALAEEEERPSRGTKRRRREHNPLDREVILIDSGDEDPSPDQVGSFLGDFLL